MESSPPPPPPPSAPPSRFRHHIGAAPVKLHDARIAEDGFPDELQDQLLELEEWAIANKKDAQRDSIAFWSLKLPAILAAASAGVLAHFELTTVSVFAGAIASLCVIVDGIHPRGMLRNMHLRAFHDLRLLSSRMMSEWRSRNRNAKAITVAGKIIRDAEDERQKIANYIREAETALNYKAQP
jgi:hypothetical protein